MATKALAVNVPTRTKIRYIDVYPNDTSKNGGKGYGASLSLKDEAGDRIYPKGFLDRNLETLRAAGVIASEVYDDNPTEKYSIPVLHGEVELCMEQPAGERYPKFTVKTIGTNGNGKPPVSREVPDVTDDKAYADALAQADGPTQWDELYEKYRQCAEAAQQIWGTDVDGQSIVAATATLFISRMNKGI